MEGVSRFHTHPLTIFVGLRRYLFILLLPLLQQVYRLVSEHTDPSSWALLLWGEIAAALLIIALSVFRWWLLRCRLSGDQLSVESGFFIRRSLTFNLTQVSSAVLEQPLWLAAFRASRIRLDTAGGSRQKADLTLLLTRKAVRAVTDRLRQEDPDANANLKIGFPHLLVMAASSSNAAAGILFAAPLINNLGKVLGEEFASRIYNTVNLAAGVLSRVLPPLTAGLATLMAVGWFIAFLRVLIRYVRMRVLRAGGMLTIQAGPVLPRRTWIPLGHINAVDIRQTLVMVPFKLRTVCLLCAGFGKEKGDREVLVPAVRPERLQRSIARLLPGFAAEPQNPLRPPKKALRRYLFVPAMLLGLLIPVFVLAWVYLPGIRFLIPWIAISAALPLVWFFLLSWIAFDESYVDLSGDICVLRCRKYFKMHQVHIPVDRVRRLDVTQNYFQWEDGVCNVKVVVYGEQGVNYIIRELPMKEALRAVDAFRYSESA